MKWKKYDYLYSVSDTGKIRNDKSSHIIKQYKGKDGYVRTQLHRKTRTVHRIIAETFIPKVEGKDFINHKDGDKTHNSVDNLEWCTRSENLLHAYRNGLKSAPIRTKNPRCKLSENDILFIKEHAKRDFLERELAEMFSVSDSEISAIVCGVNWSKH